MAKIFCSLRSQGPGPHLLMVYNFPSFTVYIEMSFTLFRNSQKIEIKMLKRSSPEKNWILKCLSGFLEIFSPIITYAYCLLLLGIC